jgi:hypothetical protein
MDPVAFRRVFGSLNDEPAKNPIEEFTGDQKMPAICWTIYFST